MEIGAYDNISAGCCGDTIIEDYAKLDVLIHIGHEAHIHKNVELIAGTIVGGFADIGDNAYVGMNSSIRNRISGNASVPFAQVMQCFTPTYSASFSSSRST